MPPCRLRVPWRARVPRTCSSFCLPLRIPSAAAIRVVHIGTGNVGRLALAELIENPAFELVGLCVSTPNKSRYRRRRIGGPERHDRVRAAGDLDALLAAEPACAVYCAMGDTRMPQAMNDVRRILAAGVNVVGSAPGVLQFPWQVIPDQFIKPVDDAARLGNLSVYINGVDPGFVTDLIPLAFASTCRRIEQVRCMEIADYATYDGAIVMFDVMGFGKPLEEVPILFQPGVLSIAWGSALRQLAAGLNISWTPSPKVTSANPPRNRSTSPLATFHGRCRGRPVPDQRHGERPSGPRRRACHPATRRYPPGLGPTRPAGRLLPVEITGEPSYAVDICPTSRHGDHNHAAIAGAAAHRQCDPAVIAAPPGHSHQLGFAARCQVSLYATP